jgi:hypothetical protein
LKYFFRLNPIHNSKFTIQHLERSDIAGGFWLPAVYAPTGVSAQKVREAYFEQGVL